MKKILLLFILFLLANCLFALDIITTTKLLENATKDIGGDRVKVHTLVVVSSCPGHADISPGQVSKAKKSDFIFYHGFEKYVKNINNPNTINFSEKGEKNLLIPKEYNLALERICNILSKKDPKNQNYYKNNFQKRKAQIIKLDKDIKSKTKSLNGKKVICSVNNKPLLIYFGFNVVATYPISDQITPKVWSNIYKIAKKENIAYCIDNYQSGKDISLQLSKDIHCRHFYTTNFPGAIKETPTMETTLKKNLNFCLNGHN